MQSAVLHIAEEAEGIAKGLAPVDTGSLQATIGVDRASLTYQGGVARVVLCAGDTSGGYTGAETRSHGSVDYAQAQEFGGASSPAHPFMGPAAHSAMESAGPRAAAILRSVML